MTNRSILLVPLFLLTVFPGIAAESCVRSGGELPGFHRNAPFDEQVLIQTNEAGVRVLINAPSPQIMAGGRALTLVLYALPNGNTIEQTVGKKTGPGEDWHFNIQHIGAQTRYLRNRFKNEPLVVAYIENSLKSWPAWRKQHGDAPIAGILDSIGRHFAGRDMRRVLTGHSGGGSLTFGYLNTVERIPDDIVRIAFLDSNYGYDTALHRDKLAGWLRASPRHSLVVLAYHDSAALLNGKTFVSESGGTWGRSRLMKSDLTSEFPFVSRREGELETASALDHRILFFLRENPEKKVWHTVQVELNGFIHALLAGSPEESKGYVYLGDRVYEPFIAE